MRGFWNRRTPAARIILFDLLVIFLMIVANILWQQFFVIVDSELLCRTDFSWCIRIIR